MHCETRTGHFWSAWRTEPAEVATATAHPLSKHVGKLGNRQSKKIQKQGRVQSEGKEILSARLTKRRLQVRVVSGSLNKMSQGIITSAGAGVLCLPGEGVLAAGPM